MKKLYLDIDLFDVYEMYENRIDVWLGDNLAEIECDEFGHTFDAYLYRVDGSWMSSIYALEEENPIRDILDRWVQMLVDEHLNRRVAMF